LERARRVIPGASQTFSKSPSQFVQGVAPTFLIRGRGSHVWDADDNEYIDYPMGLGPVILGHGYHSVVEAVRETLDHGTAMSLPHPLEIEVAEAVTRMIPCAEMVRFGKNGSDATAGAVRVARAYTGRARIACCGYHGWQDWFVGTTTRSRGVPADVAQLTHPFRYNDIGSLERILDHHRGEVAAVIMEPVGIEPPRDRFLEDVADLTRSYGALLIFDEVVTGFRLALGGAQELFEVTPDLACLGKGMANGFPLSAVAGRRDVMELFDEVFFSFTFGGEIASLAAARATLRELETKPVVEHLWVTGRQLQDGVAALAEELHLDRFACCYGYPPRTVIEFSSDIHDPMLIKSIFQQECLKRGVLFSGSHNVSYSHSTADIEATLEVYRAAMQVLAKALTSADPAAWLEGTLVQPVFREP
jgi:glutamate-1-semialdehyde 2,1-aminomutase/spore coat polysaccharide biosynthesis protein SpsF